MSQDILINWSPQETRVAVVEQGAVQEVHLERTLERGLVGNIYLGKVSRVLPGMQSAFIDIGLDRAAFLHVADLMPNIAAKHATPRGPVVPPASEPDAAASAPANGGARLLTPNPVLPVMDLAAPDTTWRGPVNFIPSARQVGERSASASTNPAPTYCRADQHGLPDLPARQHHRSDH